MDTNKQNYDYLINIGFSLNEAKVYSTLLEYDLLNGYEIAKYSGVSRSLIYNVIDRLVKKGFVNKFQGETNYYSAVDYKKIINKIKNNNEANLLIATEKLKTISKKEKNNEYILNIKGFDNFIVKAKELINEAKKEISLSLWQKEFNLIKDDLLSVISRGVKVYIFCFEDIKLDGAEIFSYRVRDPEKLFPYRRLTLIIDNSTTLIGENMGEGAITVLTRNHVLISLATDEIVLNVFWQKLIESYNLLDKCSTADGFLEILDILKDKFNITSNMTKNFMVFNFQYGGKK